MPTPKSKRCKHCKKDRTQLEQQGVTFHGASCTPCYNEKRKVEYRYSSNNREKRKRHARESNRRNLETRREYMREYMRTVRNNRTQTSNKEPHDSS